MSVGLIESRQCRKIQRVVVPRDAPSAQRVAGDQVRRALVEDTHVARDLTAASQPGPLEGLHRGADDGRRQAAQSETLDVAQWNAPAAIGDDGATD